MLDTYRGGYTKALLDVKDIIQDRTDPIVRHHRMTKKAIKFVSELIDAMIADKDTVMKYGSAGIELMQRPDGTLFIREKE